MTQVPGASIIIRRSEIFNGNISPGIVLHMIEGGVQQLTERKVQRITVLYLKKPLAAASRIESNGHWFKPCSLFQHHGCKYRDWAVGLKSVQAFS